MYESLSVFLLEAYGQSRHKCHSNGRTAIRIDSWCESDVGKDFCQMLLTIPDEETEQISLMLHNPPHNTAVRELVEKHGGQFNPCRLGDTIVFPVVSTKPGPIRELATAIHRVIGRGQRYTNRNWRWTCPRTVDALERFAGHLATFRADCRNKPCREK